MTDDAEPDQALTRARSLHKDAREELGRADAKATTLLSVAGLFLGALSAGAIAGNWTPAELKVPAEPAFWLALALAIGGEIRLLLAVLPRVDHDKNFTEARYFGHVVQMRDRKQLRACLEQADAELDQAVDQLWMVSGIVDKKYRHVRRGLQLLASGAGLGFLALLTELAVGRLG